MKLKGNGVVKPVISEIFKYPFEKHKILNLILLFIPLLILIAIYLPPILIYYSVTIGGERYWILSDDAMISMRYARNFANGLGLVFNPSDKPIEGYTNFLWTIYMAFIHLFPIAISKTSLIILLTNIVLNFFIVFILIRFVCVLGGDILSIIAVVICFILNNNVMIWSLAGFETALLTYLFTWGAYRVIKEKQQKPELKTFILIAFVSLVRADAIFLSALLYLMAFLLNENKRTVVLYVLFSLIIPVVHELFRIIYYQDILPNSAYLKIFNWENRYQAGITYVFGFIKQYYILLAIAVLGLFLTKHKERFILFLIILAQMAYVTYVGGDAFPNYRFFIPVLPLLFVLSVLSVQSINLIKFLKLKTVKVSLMLIICTYCIMSTPMIFKDYKILLSPSKVNIGNIRIALLLKKNANPSCKVADFWACSVFYFSDLYGIDLLGISDKYIAKMTANTDGMKPGHNKYDFDYSLGKLKTDFVITNFKIPVERGEMEERTSGDYGFSGKLYFNSVFQKHFFQNPITIDTWRTIFVSDWSSQFKNRTKWEELP